jgi:hypothetical protein
MPGEPPKKFAKSQVFVSALPLKKNTMVAANIMEKGKPCRKFAMLCLFV